MKIFLKSFVLFLSLAPMLSCSKDDDSVTEISENEKLLGTVDGSGVLNLSSTLDYNSDKTIRQLNLESAYLFDFLHENNTIASIVLTANGQLVNYTFTYNAQGKLASFKVGEEFIQVSYNPANNSYSYATQYNQDITITLTPDGDIKQYLLDDNVSNETTSVVGIYDNAKKGAMTNSNPIALYLGIIFGNPVAMFYIYPFSIKPLVQTSSTGGINLVFNNVYDNQGFIISSNVDSNGDSGTSDFNYISVD